MGVGGAVPGESNTKEPEQNRTPVSVSTNPACAALLAAGWAVLCYLKKAERINEKHGPKCRETTGDPWRTEKTKIHPNGALVVRRTPTFRTRLRRVRSLGSRGGADHCLVPSFKTQSLRPQSGVPWKNSSNAASQGLSRSCIASWRLGLRRLRGKMWMTLQLGSLTLVTGPAIWQPHGSSMLHCRGSLRQDPFFRRG
jgi:hypothetical protein